MAIDRIIKSTLYIFLLTILASCSTGAGRTDAMSHIEAEDTVVVSDETENVKYPNDSIAIGNVRFGLNPKDVAQRLTTFTKENPSLNGLAIDRVKDYYYQGKLIRLILISEYYTVDPYTIKNFQNYWTSIYEEKYINSKSLSEILVKYGHSFSDIPDLIINKGNVQIHVADNVSTNKVPESINFNDEHFEYDYLRLRSDAEQLKPTKLYSVIDIISGEYNEIIARSQEQVDSSKKAQKQINLENI